jgi:3,4-dihydroxy 2-butanone 4-phosphate synthase/GTP cyclohydrolase II
LTTLQASRAGVAVLLNCGQGVEALLPQLRPSNDNVASRSQMDLRTYGVGAQILRELGVTRMKLLGSPRRMPSMTGYGLEVTGFMPSAPTKSH